MYCKKVTKQIFFFNMKETNPSLDMPAAVIPVKNNTVNIWSTTYFHKIIFTARRDSVAC